MAGIEGSSNQESAPRDPTREKGYIPGKALEVARSVWGSTPKSELEGNFHCKLTREEVEILRKRMVTLGTHLVEAARVSPTTGCKGSYKAVEKYYTSTSYLVALWKGHGVPVGILRVHETLHTAVAFERGKDPVPGFLKTDRQTGDLSMLYEEIGTILLWTFNGRYARNHKDFDSALKAMYKYYYPQLRGLHADEARRKRKKVSVELKRFDEHWKQVTEKPETAFLERAKRIFEAEKSGNKKSTVQEFLTMTGNINAVV